MRKDCNKTIVRRGMAVALAFILCSLSAFALTPTEVFAKGKNMISAAKSLSADFSMKVNGQTVTGKIVSQGSKFAITSNAVSNWYNGKDLYTYTPSSQEVYIFSPTQSELQEVNPLLFLKSADDYNITGSRNKKNGLETVVLLPKKRGGVKSVSIDLDATTFLPRSITVTPSSGGPIQLTVSNLKLNVSPAPSAFEFPGSKYSKATITDMR